MDKDTLGRGVFTLLAKPIRNGLAELGFLEPTLPQKMAFPPIQAGENVLLIAPTGSGKTEAVLLPIFSNLIQREAGKGIKIVWTLGFSVYSLSLFATV